MVSILIIGLLSTASIASVYAGIDGPLEGESAGPVIPCADIYVDDDNTIGPWDGTLEHPYQHVLDGIDAADDGDMVYVFNGIYDEKLKFNKSIKFLGSEA